MRFESALPQRARGLCTALLFAMTWMYSPPSIGARAEGLEAVPIGTFNDPVHIATARHFDRLLFVVERAGKIEVLVDEKQAAEPFLDISDLVLALPEATSGEQGLLSMAFAPDYRESKRFYVFFTNLDGDIEINEFRRSSSATRADPATRRVVLVIPHREATNHYGGQLQFGPDHLLYISTGDGGRAADPGSPGDPARNLESLLGKILRIDPRQAGSAPYTVPPRNPFVDKPGLDEIFAYGLRNPWRFTFRRWMLLIGDVGQGRREEVNMLTVNSAAGANFGWPQFEGELPHSDRPGPHPPKFPIFTYDHASGGCSVIGGYIVRDSSLPDLYGRYLYGDFCTGELRSFMPRVRTQKAPDDKPAGLDLPDHTLTAFGQGVNGQLYIAQKGSQGPVSRLEPVSP